MALRLRAQKRAAPLKHANKVNFETADAVSPRAKTRGPIEAVSNTRTRASVESLRAQKRAAPLKPRMLLQTHYRPQSLRAQKRAAPLKRLTKVRLVTLVSPSPRAKTRGPIEADTWAEAVNP